MFSRDEGINLLDRLCRHNLLMKAISLPFIPRVIPLSFIGYLASNQITTDSLFRMFCTTNDSSELIRNVIFSPSTEGNRSSGGGKKQQPLPDVAITSSTKKTSKRGRKQLYVPVVASREDAEAASLKFKQWLTRCNDDQKLRICSEFIEFHNRSIETGVRFEDIIPAYVYQASEAYAISSLNTYMEYLRSAIGSMHPIVKTTFFKWRKAVQLAAADGKEQRTLPKEPDMVWEAATGSDNGMIAFLAFTGMRPADVRCLRKSQIVIERDQVTVTVKVAKNIRTPGQTGIIHFSKDLFGRIPESARRLLVSAKGTDRPFEKFDNGAIRDAYHKLLKKAHLEKHPPYILRHLVISYLMEQLDENCAEVAKYTLHKNPNHIVSYYYHYRGKESDEDYFEDHTIIAG